MNNKESILSFGVYLFVFLMVTIQVPDAKAWFEGNDLPKTFRAGAATANITPFLGGGIVDGWKTPESLHIHDE